ncbi:hemicentin-2-like, partial [Anneissia japonica]|uniref:hemicentin-2-like n=1 Tax=Anneissia japonica TaxID=1529436 RepID=UPI001425B14C
MPGALGMESNAVFSLAEDLDDVKINISSYTAVKDVTIECLANGSLPNVVKLFKDGDVIKKIENNLRLTYKIDIVTESDGGRYKCTAKNIAGSKESETTVLNYYLYDVMIDISSYTAAKNVTIECLVNGSLLTVVNLIKDGYIIKTENNLRLTYKIDIVTESDGGSYKCTATNRAGSKESETTVLNYYPPEYVDYITVAPGENVTIAPDILSNPNEVTYQWITELNDKDTDPTTFTFRASDVVGTNYAITVKATNNIGSATKSFKVTVSSVDYCVSNPCGNKGTCIPANFAFTCECEQGYSGRYCESSIYSTSLTIGILFVGIIVGAFGTVIGGLIGYTRIKRKAQIGKRSANQRQNLD